MSTRLNLTQTDIITRLRRFTGVAGKASPASTDEVQLDATVANLTADPYQQEFYEYSTSTVVAAVAANLSFGGLINPDPTGIVVVDKIEVIPGASSAFQLILNRQQNNTLGFGFSGATQAFNVGGPVKPPGLRNARANFASTSAAGGPSGGTLVANIPTGTALFTFQPPFPIQLFGPIPGPAAGGNAGDGLWVVCQVINTPLTLNMYWREYFPFKF